MNKLQKKQMEKRISHLQMKVHDCDKYIPGYREYLRGLKIKRRSTPYFLSMEQLTQGIRECGYDCEYKYLPAISRLLFMYEAWQHTKSVYTFDESFLTELIETDIDEIPSHIFSNFPEWCVYIDTDILNEDGMPKINGFFAYPLYSETEMTYIALLLVFEYKDIQSDLCNIKTGFNDIVVDFKNGIINIGQIIKDHDVSNSTVNEYVKWKFDKFRMEQPFEYIQNNRRQMEKFKRHLSNCLNLLMYICTEDKDITRNGIDINTKPVQYTKNKNNNLQIKTKDKFQYLKVGARVGKAIRESKNNDSESLYRVRPHLRKGHWHKYWIGSRKEELAHERQITLKWIPPIMINAKSPDEIPFNIKKL